MTGLWMARPAFTGGLLPTLYIKPWQSITGSMGPLMSTNKAAWGLKLLMIVSAYQVDCSSFCALLNTQHCCLSPCGWYFPPSASHHPQRLPRPSTPYKLHPRYCRSCKKLSEKPAVLATYVTELRSYKTLAIWLRILYLCCESGISTVGHQWARVAWIFQNGISPNIKYSTKPGFLKSSHKYCHYTMIW